MLHKYPANKDKQRKKGIAVQQYQKSAGDRQAQRIKVL